MSTDEVKVESNKRKAESEFVDPSLQLKNSLPYFENIDTANLRIVSTPWRNSTTPRFNVHLTDVTDQNETLQFWTPFCTSRYTRMFPLGNLAHLHPNKNYTETNARELKYSLQLMSQFPHHPALATEHGQDENMVKFMKFMNKLTTIAADGIFDDANIKERVVTATRSSMSSMRAAFGDTTPTTPAKVRSHFHAMHVARPVRHQKAPFIDGCGYDDGGGVCLSDGNMPNTEFVTLSDRVFKKNKPRSAEIRNSDQYAPITKLHGFMLDEGYIFNDIPMINAANMKTDASGCMTPIPLSQRHLDEGDVVSVLVRVVPYEFSPGSSSCGISLQPVSVIFLKNGESYKSRKVNTRSIPRSTMTFEAGMTTDYDTLNREAPCVSSSDLDYTIRSSQAVQLKPDTDVEKKIKQFASY
jgi:hypothetical protein